MTINNKEFTESKRGERNTNDVGRKGESGEAKVKVTAATTSTSTSHPHTANDLGRDSVEDIYNAFSPECTLRNSDVESSNSTLYSLSP